MYKNTADRNSRPKAELDPLAPFVISCEDVYGIISCFELGPKTIKCCVCESKAQPHVDSHANNERYNFAKNQHHQLVHKMQAVSYKGQGSTEMKKSPVYSCLGQRPLNMSIMPDPGALVYCTLWLPLGSSLYARGPRKGVESNACSEVGAPTPWVSRASQLDQVDTPHTSILRCLCQGPNATHV